MARRRPWTALLGLVLAVASCTSPGEQPVPSPTPAQPPPANTPAMGVRVGFVLPPAASDDDEQRIQLAASVQLVDSLREEGISEIRALPADGPEFVSDLAALLADRRTDLICVLGSDAQRVLLPLATRHPQLRFCAVPAGSAEPPGNLIAVEVRFEELGHVVGLAAATAAGEGPVASIIGADRIGVGGLRAGIRAGAGDLEVLESTPSDEEGVREALDAAIEAGATVLILDVGVAAGPAVERAVASGMQIVAPAAVLAQADVEGSPLLSWRMRWDVPLRPVIASMLDPDAEVPRSVGLAENVFVVSLGGGLQGAAREVVEEAVMELRRGARDPLEAPARPTPDPEDGEDGEDEEGDGGEDGDG
jgi:basic membrane lipoprotein Med (substrate-binding protein (PBP1-ABC) superfamily)